MKLIKIIVAIAISSITMAQDCKYSQSYADSGWKIHPAQTFNEHAKNVLNLIKNGLENGSVVFDISGPILTDQTINSSELLLDAMMFDNLQTPQDQMYGDYAILETTDSSRQLVEVRWYDGVQRNIAINPNFLKCQSEGAPYVDNSVL